MAKLLVVLLLGIYLTFQLGGNDPASVRPGLVGVPAELIAAKPVVAPVETRKLASDDTSLSGASTALTAASASQRIPLSPTPPAVDEELVPVKYSPEPAAVAPTRPAEKVFTLSALPGQGNATAEVATPQVAAPAATPAAEVWYVTGRSVNVRQGPSTDAPIVGRLSRGEAALMLADNGAGWAEITIEGDGVTGYVSLDFLSPTAP